MSGFSTKYLSYVFSFGWGLGLASVCAMAVGYQLQVGVALLCVLMAGFLILFSCRILKADAFEDGPSNFLGKEVLLNAILLHLCIIVGLGALGVSQQLWVPDSTGLHMPGVNTVLSFCRGESDLPMGSAFGGRVQLTYLWVGVWVWMFGPSPVVTSLALLVIKSLIWILVLKESEARFGGRVAALALLLMAFAPTQIFYSVVFYKEPIVQLFLAVALFSALRLYDTGLARHFIVGGLAAAVLVLERIYLAPMAGAGLLIAFLTSPKIKTANRMKQHFMLWLGLAGVGGFFAVYFQDFSVPYVFDGLAWARQNYMNSPDVNQELNANIWYPLAVIKLVFSPYLTPSKFNIFLDLSALLTWGGPISQVIMLAAIVGFWTEIRKNLMRTLIVAFPFALFLLLFGYLAPFSGRQRDSFLPAISMFAALGIVAFVRRKKRF